MNKRYDEAGSISWQDAFRLWKEVEVYYGVTITISNGYCRAGKNKNVLVLNLYYSKVVGTAASKREHYGFLEYPHANYATLPAGFVHHLNKLCGRLEAEREREKKAIAQLPLFPSGQ